MFLVQLQWVTILAQAAAEKPVDWQGTLLSSPLIPMALTLAAFFIFFTRADMKKQQAQRQMLKDLKKNDTIVTVGGVCGTIVQATPESRYVTIRVDDTNNTRLRILRSAISSIDAGEEPAEKDAN